MLLAACQVFIGKTEGEIRKIAQETLEGHQRAIMGNMTVEVVHALWMISAHVVNGSTCGCHDDNKFN